MPIFGRNGKEPAELPELEELKGRQLLFVEENDDGGESDGSGSAIEADAGASPRRQPGTEHRSSSKRPSNGKSPGVSNARGSQVHHP